MRDRRPIARMYRAASLEAELIMAVVMMQAGWSSKRTRAEAARLQRHAARVRRWIDRQLMEGSDA